MRYRGRGRPKYKNLSADLGTLELQIKRQIYATEEIIDRYLRKSIINSQQHWCGMHFRWLYTKRYGLPGIKAYSPLDKGRLCVVEDTVKIKYLHDEYKNAVDELNDQQIRKAVMDVIIYNVDILNPMYNDFNYDTFVLKERFIDGMNILVNTWCHGEPKG